MKMKHLGWTLLLAASLCAAQEAGDFRPAETNVWGALYPRVDGAGRVEVRMKAIEANMIAPMKGLSLEVARHNVTINNLLPERFDTDRQHQMAKAAMARENISYDEARAHQVESIAAKRLGDPKEFGATCAFLCSAHAGFMSGQNLHLDGGSYPALT